MIIYKKYRKLYKYKLVETYSHPIKWLQNIDGEIPGGWAKIQNGLLIIKKDYTWDGPSGPTFDTKTFMRGSLVHDALYQLMREGVFSRSIRRNADKEMAKINAKDGMNKFRIWYTYIAVRIFGKFTSQREKPKILTAP